MPCLGGFCPLPLRLGGEDHSSWTPEQHARVCADVSAMVASAPLALVTFNTNLGGSSLTINSFESQWKTGISNAPTATILGMSSVKFDFPLTAIDDYGITHPVQIRHAVAQVHGSVASLIGVTIGTANDVTVTETNPWGILHDDIITLVVW
jgi:hypothetical protein